MGNSLTWYEVRNAWSGAIVATRQYPLITVDPRGVGHVWGHEVGVRTFSLDS